MILFRKAVRTIWRSKKAYLACMFLMGMGISVYIAFNMLFLNLQGAMESMYRQQRFADAFAQVRSMPVGDVQRLQGIDGVARADATLSADARVEGLDSRKIITLRLSSFDPEAQARLNDFLLVKGELPGEGELLVNKAFADFHGLEAGDVLTLVVAGRRVVRTISGVVQSPEYIYAIPDLSQMFPDDEGFGFGYLDQRQLGTLTGKSGVANSVAFALEPGVAYDDVKHRLEDELAPYGLERLYPRKDQVSHAMLQQEIDSIGSMAASLPMVFILMAVIILYIMLGRVIQQERSQIGTLKAFGFTGREIVLHYMGYGGITGLAGGVLGLVLGAAMTGGLTDMFLVYFNLPALHAAIDPVYIAVGLGISVGSGLLGAYMGTRGVLRLNPSEAMRPPAPPVVKHDLVGRLPFLRALLASSGYMAVRNITRNKFRSAFVVCGIAFSFSIMAFMASYTDIMDAMLLEQFDKVQLYDMKITLERPSPYTAAVEAAWSLGGVERAEGLLEVPVELRRGHLKDSVTLTGIERDSALYQVYDSLSGQTLPLREGGVVLSASLAGSLQAEKGDLLLARTPYTGDDELPLPVLGIVNENLGKMAYVELDTLCALLEAPRSVSGVLLRTGDTDRVKDQLLEADNVAAMNDTGELQRMYRELLASYDMLFLLMQLAGIGIAFAIITNTASISLSERGREYATMRVLGMHPREIGRVVGFEYWLLMVVGILPGIPLTRLIKMAMQGMIDNELFQMPVDTPLRCFVVAGVGCGVTVALSNWSATRKIARLAMVEVLKERE